MLTVNSFPTSKAFVLRLFVSECDDRIFGKTNLISNSAGTPNTQFEWSWLAISINLRIAPRLSVYGIVIR